jgi:hypothetical protein
MKPTLRELNQRPTRKRYMQTGLQIKIEYALEN